MRFLPPSFLDVDGKKKKFFLLLFMGNGMMMMAVPQGRLIIHTGGGEF